jgi:hypothetical protein
MQVTVEGGDIERLSATTQESLKGRIPYVSVRTEVEDDVEGGAGRRSHVFAVAVPKSASQGQDRRPEAPDLRLAISEGCSGLLGGSSPLP